MLEFAFCMIEILLPGIFVAIILTGLAYLPALRRRLYQRSGVINTMALAAAILAGLVFYFVVAYSMAWTKIGLFSADDPPIILVTCTDGVPGREEYNYYDDYWFKYGSVWDKSAFVRELWMRMMAANAGNKNGCDPCYSLVGEACDLYMGHFSNSVNDIDRQQLRLGSFGSAVISGLLFLGLNKKLVEGLRPGINLSLII